ncbi:MAG: hypothetical protein HYZ63_03010 [Candidatus Andersenbacteria bacterium]|nr:hypothetical protein [Candidatus Andersenbacteria bacterium]
MQQSLNDGSGEARIFIREATGIEKPRLTKGTFVSVIGLVSETKSGYRVMPRWQEDVFFGVRPKVSSTATGKKSSSSAKKGETLSPICPSPTGQKNSEAVCAPQVSGPSFLLSNSVVFTACMLVIMLIISAARAREPLLVS